MNTAEAAKKWDVTTGWVRDRCNEGMIPLAEKINFKWEIQEKAKKPLCTKHSAIKLLKRIDESSKGVDIELFPGDDDKAIEEIYLYLSDCGFITRIKGNNIRGSLKSASVTTEGRELMESVKKKKNYDSKKTKYSAGVKTDHFEASLETEVSKSGNQISNHESCTN